MPATTRQVDPLFDLDVVQNPHPYYGELRENDPVHEVVPGVFLVTRMDLIHDVVGRTDVFSSDTAEFLHKGDWPTPGLRAAMSSHSGSAGILATADPPDHQRQRRVVGRAFSAAAIREMEPGFRALVEEALAGVGSDGRLEWMSSIAEPLPMVMVARILGLPDSTAPELKKQGYAMVERISGFVAEGDVLQLEEDGINGLTSVLEAYAEARRDSTDEHPGLIGAVAEAVSDGELDELEALGILAMIISAGGESTTSLAGTAVRILAEAPELQDRLRADPSLIPTFVEEALRYDPPFRGHYRVVVEDTTLGGIPLSAGSRLVLMWSAANRDDAVYDDPEDIRLDRSNPRTHVGFGWGIHLCVGAPLARMEARVALETLLAKTRGFHFDGDAGPLRYHPSLMVRRPVALPLVLTGI